MQYHFCETFVKTFEKVLEIWRIVAYNDVWFDCLDVGGC